MEHFDFGDCRAPHGTRTDQEQLHQFMGSSAVADVIFKAGVRAGVIPSSDESNYTQGRLHRIRTRTHAAQIFNRMDWEALEQMGVTKAEARPYILRQLKRIIEGPTAPPSDEE